MLVVMEWLMSKIMKKDKEKGKIMLISKLKILTLKI